MCKLLHMPPTTKSCDACYEDFPPKSTRHRFCSPYCASAHRFVKRILGYEPVRPPVAAGVN